MKRDKKKCSYCERRITVKKGSGPYAQGRGDLMWHKWNGIWCPGSDEKPKESNP